MAELDVAVAVLGEKMDTVISVLDELKQSNAKRDARMDQLEHHCAVSCPALSRRVDDHETEHERQKELDDVRAEVAITWPAVWRIAAVVLTSGSALIAAWQGTDKIAGG
jgi:hypothetical protein